MDAVRVDRWGVAIGGADLAVVGAIVSHLYFSSAREGGREGVREGGRVGGREGGRVGGREGGWEGGKEGGWEEGKERG